MPTLDWIGKKAVENHHKEVPYRLLRGVPELSAGEPGTGNLLVQGDNLEALKALLPYYAGKVKCVYIDPPYNTGNENWIYNDAVNSPEMRQWLGTVVGRDDLSRHDKWLCMMYPRLTLLREFLMEDGAIFVSIDDTECASLRLIMDDIYGRANFVANIVWQKKYSTSNDHTGICPMHDHIIAYRKSDLFQRNLLPRTEDKDRQYKYEDENGLFRVSDYTCNKNSDERPNLYYPIKQPNTGLEIYPQKTRVWAYSMDVYEDHCKQNLIYWGKDGKARVPSFKRYKSALRRGGGTVPPSWWDHEFAGHTDGAKKEFRNIVGTTSELDFFTPKPTLLVQRIIQIASGRDDVVMDSFCGSGTTAQAVLQLNQENCENRRFILVELDSKIARDIAVKRVRGVIQGYTNSKGVDVPGLGGGFNFCELGETLFNADGTIRGSVTFSDLAHHVFFTELREPLPGAVDGTTPLLGAVRGTAVYLLYNGVLKDKRPKGGNVLTMETLRGLPPHAGPKVVYGTACTLGAGTLRRHGVTFRQIPYEVKSS